MELTRCNTQFTPPIELHELSVEVQVRRWCITKMDFHRRIRVVSVGFSAGRDNRFPVSRPYLDLINTIVLCFRLDNRLIISRTGAVLRDDSKPDTNFYCGMLFARIFSGLFDIISTRELDKFNTEHRSIKAKLGKPVIHQ